MRIEKKEAADEKRVLTGMIVDTKVLSRIYPKWNREMFRNKWSNLIGQWCIDFYSRYEKAPMKHIEGMFEGWAEKSKDRDTIRLVEKFIGTLSDEYKSLKKESNSDYITDLAGKYFNRVQIEKLQEKIQGDLDLGQEEEALRRISSYGKIELGQGVGINVFQDKQALQEAFSEQMDPIIKFRGAMGKFWGDSLERDGFITFMAPEKRGKTWNLIEMAFQAVQQRRKVVFFAAGDMSEKQMMRRMMIRVSGRPLKPGVVKIPVSIKKDPDEKIAKVKYKKKRYKDKLSWQKAYQKCQDFIKKTRTKEPLLKLVCYPNSTLSVKMIKNTLMEWDREGWTADVVIIDYADILDMNIPGTDSQRERINETWKQLRSLSQIYHCLVITATQTNSQSYEARTISRSHFSDDKRKIGHVTGAVGINATEREMERGIYRFNWVVRREEAANESWCVYTAGCLAIGNPIIKSCFGKNAEGEDEK